MANHGHRTDVRGPRRSVRTVLFGSFRGQSGRHLLSMSFSHYPKQPIGRLRLLSIFPQRRSITESFFALRQWANSLAEALKPDCSIRASAGTGPGLLDATYHLAQR